MAERSTGNTHDAAEALAGPAERAGVRLTGAQAAELGRYAERVLAWTQRVDLTGARTVEAFLAEHVADALPLLARLPAGPGRVVDVGSGAGLPGLVLAVVRPDLDVVLLEPRERRWAFLREAVRELGLGRVEVRRERLEEHVASAGFRPYEVAVSRATWPAAEWMALAVPLVGAGGVVLAVEGRERGMLPAGAERFVYDLGRGERAVLVWRPASASTR